MKSSFPTIQIKALYWSSLFFISFIAFEVIAITTAMPAISQAIQGQKIYALAFGVAIASQLAANVVAGFICDRYGPFYPVIAGIALFILGVVLAGLSPNMQLFILARCIQGAGAGASVVTLYVIVSDLVPDNLQPKFFAGFSAAWVLPSLVGPALAGWIVQHTSWRIIFLLIPVFMLTGLLIVIPYLRHLKLRRAPVASQLDENGKLLPVSSKQRKVIGASLLASIAVGILQIIGADSAIFTHNMQLGLAICFGILLLVALPSIFPTGMFTIRWGLPACVAARLFLLGPFTAAEMYIPIFLSAHDWTYSQAGIVITVGSISWALASHLQSYVLDVRKRAVLPFIGSAIGAFGMLMVAVAVVGFIPISIIVIGWFIAGFGVGISFPAITIFALNQSVAGQSGQASGYLQLADTIGSAANIALAGYIAGLFAGTWQYTSVMFAAGLLIFVSALMSIRASAR